MSEVSITRSEADLMGLQFLRDHGPDTIGVIETEEQMAAALIFHGLVKAGLARSTNFGGGNVQYAITDAGLRTLTTTTTKGEADDGKA